MRILIISGSPIMGGAEQVARGLAKGLAKSECQVTYVCIYPEGINQKGINQYIVYNKKFEKTVLRSIRYFSYPLAYFLNTKYAINHLKSIISKEKPDIINIHNIKQAFWSPEFVAFCADHAPVVWTLHDMSSFTGRCVHAQLCTNFISGCDESCKNIHIPVIIPRSLTKNRWLQQKKIQEKYPNIIAVSPSLWLANQASKSIWINSRVEIIPNGISQSDFYPIEKNKARKLLGLPSDLKLIMTAAFDLSAPLKGGRNLFESLNSLNYNSFGLITIGNRYKKIKRKINFPIFNLGFVDVSKMALAYSAADIFVHPSLAESFGLVVIEANACGTPVVTYANTALKEIVKEGVNGWLVDECTSDALSQKILWVLNNSGVISDRKVHDNCIGYVRSRYLIEYQIKKYLTLFSEICNSKNS